MPRFFRVVLIFLPLAAAFARENPAPQDFNERGDIRVVPKYPPRIFLGGELAITRHVEEGLDRSKGDYAAAYTAFGGSAVLQYHLSDYYFAGGIGAMKLIALKVNDLKIDLSNRTQWHLPFYAHAFYKLDSLFAIGAGITHLTELSQYVDGEKVPKSSYSHLFIDIAFQVSPAFSDNLRLVFTPILGINTLPGRQNVYSVFDMLHLRFQFNVGLLFRIK